MITRFQFNRYCKVFDQLMLEIKTWHLNMHDVTCSHYLCANCKKSPSTQPWSEGFQRTLVYVVDAENVLPGLPSIGLVSIYFFKVFFKCLIDVTWHYVEYWTTLSRTSRLWCLVKTIGEHAFFFDNSRVNVHCWSYMNSRPVFVTVAKPIEPIVNTL